MTYFSTTESGFLSLSGKMVSRLLVISLVLAFTGCRAQREARLTETVGAGRDFYREFSQKLGYQLNGTENPELIREAASWLGTPHRFGGNTRQGADCSGFVLEVYRLIYNKSLPRSSADMASHTQKLGKSQLQEGDLVFFRTSGGRKVSHVGIYLSNNKFIHASSTRGVIVSDLDEPYYLRTFAQGGRVR